MTFIPIKLDDVQEATAVAEGEYELQIIKAEFGESKKGNSMVTVTMRVLDEPTAQLVSHWLVPPKAGDPEDQVRMRRLDIARFCSAFGIPTEGGGFDTDDFPGQRAKVYLKKEVGEQDGNEYNRLRLPKLAKE